MRQTRSSSRPYRARSFPSWLIAAPTLAATGVLWMPPELVPWVTREPVLLVGVTASVYLWLMVLVHAAGRGEAVMRRRELEATQNRKMLVEEPSQPARSKSIPLTYTPGMLVLGLSLLLTFAMRTQPETVNQIEARFPYAIQGALTVVFWLAGLAGFVQHRAARKLVFEHRAAERGTELAVDALEHLPVMVSVCTPDGVRKHLNARFREVTGQDKPHLEGKEWLERVHQTDRPAFKQLFGGEEQPSKTRKKEPAIREVEYGLVAMDGTNRWVRERFVPRRDFDGKLVGYLAVGIDITAQVENETDNVQTIERLNDELEAQRQARDLAQKECDRQKAEAERFEKQVVKLMRSRDRLQDRIDAARDVARAADQKLLDARDEMAQARAECKTLRTEYQHAKNEIRRLNQSVSQLGRQQESLQKKEVKARDQAESRQRLLEQAKSTSTESRQRESQLRTKVNVLTGRCQELEQELETLRAAQSRTQQDIAQAHDEADARVEERTRAFAETLRSHAQGLEQRVRGLAGAPLSEDQLDVLEDAQASAATLTVFLDEAMGRGGDEADGAGATDPEAQSSAVRSFDLRAAVQSVAEQLQATASSSGVKIACAVDPEFPPRVSGDSVRVREAMLLLGTRALELAGDGTLTLQLIADGATADLVAAKVAIRHDTTSKTLDELHDHFGALPDGSSTNTAWALVRAMNGEYGIDTAAGDAVAAVAPGTGAGFCVWFSLNLARRGAPTQEAPPDTAEAPGGAFAPPAPSPRLPQELLKSNLGEVKELGSHSARLRTTKDLQGYVTLSLIVSGDERIDLIAEVESSKRTGLRGHDVVLRFVDLTPQQQQHLMDVAMAHRPAASRPVT